MKINYNYFILGFVLFVIIKLIFDDFEVDSWFSIIAWAVLAGVLTGFLMTQRNKPIKGLVLKLHENETIVTEYAVNIKQTKFNWVRGNFFVTNQRFSFVDKQRLDFDESFYDIKFSEVEDVIFLTRKFLKNERIKMVTNKGEVFYIDAFENNKALYESILKVKS